MVKKKKKRTITVKALLRFLKSIKQKQSALSSVKNRLIDLLSVLKLPKEDQEQDAEGLDTVVGNPHIDH